MSTHLPHNVAAHGARIPVLGFGTWRLTGVACARMVQTALEIGYRHIDTARMYGNEKAVGEGLAASGLPRDEVFVTTKVWPDDFRADALLRAARDSAGNLGGYADLLLLHWPNPDIPLRETLSALARAREEGLTRHIGVSNFTTALLDQATGVCPAPLVADQVEYHPFLDQDAVLGALRRRGMALIAYAPTAHGKPLGHPVVEAIARRHGKTPIQIALRWLVQQDGVCAIPRTGNPDHARSNFAIFDFTLSDEDMAALSALRSPRGRLISPAGLAPRWDG